MHHPPLQAIVFDMDGTLLDSAAAVPDAYIRSMAVLDGQQLTRDQVISAYPLGPPAQILQHFLGRAAEHDEIEHYHDSLRDTRAMAVLYPGMAETLIELRRHVRLAVFTGASTPSCEILLDGPGLIPHFEHLVGSDLVPRPKPAPDGLLLTCERLGLEPQQVAYVGDSPLDQQAARAAGTLAVAAGWGHLFDPHSDADLVAARPADLLELVR